VNTSHSTQRAAKAGGSKKPGLAYSSKTSFKRLQIVSYETAHLRCILTPSQFHELRRILRPFLQRNGLPLSYEFTMRSRSTFPEEVTPSNVSSDACATPVRGRKGARLLGKGGIMSGTARGRKNER